MQSKKRSNNFFLISFLPAILYWYLETKYPVKIALIGGIILSIAEIVFEKLYIGHVHQLSKFNFFLIIFLGGFSLLEENGVWFKLQPSLSLWAVAGYMLARKLKGESFMQEMMKEAKPDGPSLPEVIFKSMDKNLIILFFLYGLWMGGLAIWGQTSWWVFFKTAGFIVVLLIFFPIQYIQNKKVMQDHLKKDVAEGEV
jgi:intracellular septation protein